MSSGARAASKLDKKTTLHHRSWRRAPGGASRRLATAAPRFRDAGSTTFTKIANKWNTALIGADAASSVILNFLWERRWRVATASVPRRPHDVFSRGRGQYPRDARPAGAESVLTLNLHDRTSVSRRRPNRLETGREASPDGHESRRWREGASTRRDTHRSSARTRSRPESRSASTRRCRAASRPSFFIPQKS